MNKLALPMILLIVLLAVQVSATNYKLLDEYHSIKNHYILLEVENPTLTDDWNRFSFNLTGLYSDLKVEEYKIEKVLTVPYEVDIYTDTQQERECNITESKTQEKCYTTTRKKTGTETRYKTVYEDIGAVKSKDAAKTTLWNDYYLWSKVKYKFKVSYVTPVNSKGNWQINPDGWFNTTWNNRVNYTVTNGHGTPIINYTTFINVTIQNDMSENGSDLRVVVNDTEIPFDIEVANVSLGGIAIHARLDSLPAGDTVFEVYYNATDALNGEDPAGAWAGWEVMWLLNDNTSAVNSYELKANSFEGDEFRQQDECKAGGCVFMNDGEYFSVELFDHTVSTTAGYFVLFTIDASQDGWDNLYSHFETAGCGQRNVQWRTDPKITPSMYCVAYIHTGFKDDGIWHQYASIGESGKNLRYFINGTLKNRAALGAFQNTDPTFYMGADVVGGSTHAGYLDQFGITFENRSLEFSNMTFNNMMYYSDTVSEGAVEYVTSAPPAAPATENPTITTPTFSPASPTTDNNISCNATPTDATNLSLNVEYWWYNSTTLTFYGNHTEVVNNTNTVINTLTSGNTSYSETWNCTVRAFDGTNYSSYASATVTTAAAPSANSCTPPAINTNWVINGSHNCNITANDARGTGCIVTEDDGQVNINANLTAGCYIDNGTTKLKVRIGAGSITIKI